MKPSRNNLENVLEAGLMLLEAGSSIDEIVSGFPTLSAAKAAELRELLQIAAAARPEKEILRVPAAAQRTSRQLLLAQAQELQRQPGAAGLRFWLRSLRFFQHQIGTIAFAAAVIALLFVAMGSLNALPGDGLYPVKLAAEQAEINLAGSGAAREGMVSSFDSRRAEEVAAMIRMNRTGAVSFGGYLYSTKDRQWQVTGIPLQLNEAMTQQATLLNDVYVEIRGLLGEPGIVQVESLTPRTEPITGTIVRIEAGEWTVDSHLVVIKIGTQVSGTPQVGSQVQVQAARMVDSTRWLAITAAITGEQFTATVPPQASPTTAAPTETATPTRTPVQTNPAKPVPTESPVDHGEDDQLQNKVPDDEDDHRQETKKTAESEGYDHEDSYQD